MTLDNRIFLLQKTEGLTPDLRRQLVLADIAYLQDHDSDAQQIITGIEQECVRQEIPIFSLTNDPLFAMMGQ
jgi:hypothetical protein